LKYPKKADPRQGPSWEFANYVFGRPGVFLERAREIWAKASKKLHLFWHIGPAAWRRRCAGKARKKAGP
jgi:hypothetical protein